MEAIKKYSKWISLVGCLLVIIGVFLPFLGVSIGGYSKSVSYMEVQGRALFITLAMAEILLFLKQEKYALVPSAISLFFVIYDLASNSDYTAKVGAYMIIIGIIVVIVFSILPLFKSGESSQGTTQPVVAAPTPSVAEPTVQTAAPVTPMQPTAPVQQVAQPQPAAPVGMVSQPTVAVDIGNGQNTQV